MLERTRETDMKKEGGGQGELQKFGIGSGEPEGQGTPETGTVGNGTIAPTTSLKEGKAPLQPPTPYSLAVSATRNNASPTEPEFFTFEDNHVYGGPPVLRGVSNFFSYSGEEEDQIFAHVIDNLNGRFQGRRSQFS